MDVELIKMWLCVAAFVLCIGVELMIYFECKDEDDD